MATATFLHFRPHRHRQFLLQNATSSLRSYSSSSSNSDENNNNKSQSYFTDVKSSLKNTPPSPQPRRPESIEEVQERLKSITSNVSQSKHEITCSSWLSNIRPLNLKLRPNSLVEMNMDVKSNKGNASSELKSQFARNRSFGEIRESLHKLNNSEQKKKADLSSPQELENYFHPDHMSSAEKQKLELKSVKDKFKISESDCGLARVQDCRARGAPDSPQPVTRRACRIRYLIDEIPIVPDMDKSLIKGDEDIPHILLCFGLNTKEWITYKRIRRIQLLEHRSIDWELIETLGQADRVRRLLAGRWADVLACDAPQYKELTHEFFCTFRHKAGQFDEADAVSFNLGRQPYEMTVPEFAVATGFYTDAEVAMPAFRQSLRGYVLREREGWILDCLLAELWGDIAEGPHSSTVLESSIRDPVYRYIHRLVACTLNARHFGQENCNNLDLFCLYCIVSGRDANIATILLSALAKGRHVKGTSTRLAYGPYITRIAERLGVFDRYPVDFFTRGPDTTVWGLEDARKAGICSFDDPPQWVEVRSPQSCIIVPHTDRQQPSPPPP